MDKPSGWKSPEGWIKTLLVANLGSPSAKLRVEIDGKLVPVASCSICHSDPGGIPYIELAISLALFEAVTIVDDSNGTLELSTRQ